MSMRFRRGAIRARDIDGEPAAVKLQVRIRGFVSVVPAVPRLKTRPTFVRCFINSHFFRDRWTLNAARENPLYYQCTLDSFIRLKNFKASCYAHAICNEYQIFATNIIFLDTIYFSDTLIFLRARIYFDKFKLVLHFFFKLFRRNLIEWREAREWVIRGKKKRRSN